MKAQARVAEDRSAKHPTTSPTTNNHDTASELAASIHLDSSDKASETHSALNTDQSDNSTTTYYTSMEPDSSTSSLERVLPGPDQTLTSPTQDATTSPTLTKSHTLRRSASMPAILDDFIPRISSLEFQVALPRSITTQHASPLSEEVLELPDSFMSNYDKFRIARKINLVYHSHFYYTDSNITDNTMCSGSSLGESCSLSALIYRTRPILLRNV